MSVRCELCVCTYLRRRQKIEEKTKREIMAAKAKSEAGVASLSPGAETFS